MKKRYLLKKTFTSWTLLVACNTMWALQFTCIRLTREQVGPYLTGSGPMFLATVLLVPFVWKDLKNGKKFLKDIPVFIPRFAANGKPLSRKDDAAKKDRKYDDD